MIGLRGGLRAGLFAAAIAVGIQADTVGPMTSAAVVPTKKLVVDFGQSNTGGLCVAANVTSYGSDLTLAFPAVTMLSRVAYSLANPPAYAVDGPGPLAPRTTSGGSYTAGMGGAELTCMRELTARTPHQWFELKRAIDGSSLPNHWNQPTFPTGGPTLIASIIADIQAAAAAWGITDLANNVVLKYRQGEADTGQLYATYLAALDSMFAQIRAAIGNCWIVISRLSSQNDLLGEVRAAEESFAAGDARCAIVRSDELAMRDGPPPTAKHYADNSYATLGVRDADAIISLTTGAVQAGPYYVGAGPITTATSGAGMTPTIIRHQTGDILVFVLSSLGNNTYALSTPNNFAALFPDVHDGVALDARLQAWWVRATSNAMPAPIMANTTGQDSKIGQVHVIRGCRTSGNPFAATATATAASSTAVSVPGLVTTTPNQLITAYAAIRVDLAVPQFSQASWSNPDLASVTNQVNFESTSGAGYGLGVATGTKVAIGSVQAFTATLLTASTQAVAAVAWSAT